MQHDACRAIIGVALIAGKQFARFQWHYAFHCKIHTNDDWWLTIYWLHLLNNQTCI